MKNHTILKYFGVWAQKQFMGETNGREFIEDFCIDGDGVVRKSWSKR